MICAYFLWFIILSFGGWILETLFCTIQHHQWENRGFLYGPLCPIYGVGGLGIVLIYRFLLDAGIQLNWWQVFLLTSLGSVPLEYFTHWALEKLFHAYWWDYSNVPFNLHGRVCLPAALLFGVLGVFTIFVVYPLLNGLTSFMPEWVLQATALVFTLLLGADLALTVSALSRFYQMVSQAAEQANEQMEQFVGAAFSAGHNFIEERRNMVSRLHDGWAGNVGSSMRHTLRRVKGFRTPELPEVKESLEELLTRLKLK